MADLRVLLDLAERVDGDAGSVVHLVVRDSSMADDLHPEVAKTSIPLEHVESGQVVIEVPEESMSPGRRYTLFAHVDRTGDGAIEAGDMITTSNIPVSLDDLGPDSVSLHADLRRI